MCGIAGVIHCGNEEIISRMLDKIRHRGPNDEGIKWFPEKNSGLGHRRLSILDLSKAGHQPMCDNEGKIWITYNGEIYNYKEIKKELEEKGYNFKSNTDTEVLIYAYKEWGNDFLLKLNGMFAFVIYDSEKDVAFAARDRIGIKPIYYYQGNNSLIFASEIKGIIASGLAPVEPDYEALTTPTRYQIAPFTGFKNIKKIPPGYCFEFKKGNLELWKYWDIENFETEDIDENEAVERLDYLLNDSVKMQMLSDVPVGIFLSGGLDSSLIGALIRKNTNQNIHSYTIKFSEEDSKFERNFDDSFYAKKIAEKFGFVHNVTEINPDIEYMIQDMTWHMDEPISDPACINSYMMSRQSREKGVYVMLNGMGGDEIFGGYRKQLACLKADTYQKIFPGFIRNMIFKAIDLMPVASKKRGYKSLRWLKRFLSFASYPQYERFLMSDLSLSPEQFKNMYISKPEYKDSLYYKLQLVNFEKNISYLSKMCLNDTRVFLPAHNLMYTDKSTMAAGVESRPPLTDHRIVEYMFSLPPKYKIKGNQQKYLLKKTSEKYLPNEIIYRPKAPFGSPIRSWIKGPLRKMVDDLLTEDVFKKLNLYNYKFVKEIVKRDRDGLEDNSLTIWTMLVNVLWFNTFFG